LARRGAVADTTLRAEPARTKSEIKQTKKERGFQMALSGTDHIEALRAQLNNNLKEKEAEILEIREVLRALGDAPKILSGKPTTN